MKAVLFDLDDTLYAEIEFVKSGFRAAARFLGSTFDLDQESLFEQMLDILHRDGRGKVFDSLLADLGLFSMDRVRLLIHLYRSHMPDISPYEDTLPTLERLKSLGISLGMVTDGMASVQRNKIASLGLQDIFDAIICSDALGVDCWKPSAGPYNVALELLKVPPSQAAYVGNDPLKDFIAPNSMGMLTIQIRRRKPEIREQEKIPDSASADFTVMRLDEILPIIGERSNAS